MLNTTQLVILIAAGAIASVAYFGGLWLTVKHLYHTPSPLRTYISSFAVRMSLLGLGAFMALQLGWQALLAAMFGFLLVRYAITLAIGLPKLFVNHTKSSDKESRRTCHRPI